MILILTFLNGIFIYATFIFIFMLVAGQDRDPNLRIAMNRDEDITVSDGSQALVVTVSSSITAHHQVR